MGKVKTIFLDLRFIGHFFALYWTLLVLIFRTDGRTNERNWERKPNWHQNERKWNGKRRNDKCPFGKYVNNNVCKAF